MSDQREAGVITSLEEVFTSREFLRAPVRRTLLGSASKMFSGPPQLEQVFWPEQFGRPRDVSPQVTLAGSHGEPAVPADAGAVAVLSTPLRGSNRDRAIAAVSGIAAAAVVVAGLASGTAQPRRADVAAQEPLVGVHRGDASATPRGVSRGGDVSGPAALTAASNATGGSPSMTLTGESNQPVSSASTPAVTRQVAPTSTAASIPAAPSTASVSAGPSGDVSAPGSPSSPSPPAAPPTKPLSPAMSVVSNVAATAGVATMADQLGSSLALPAPANSTVRDMAATTA